MKIACINQGSASSSEIKTKLEQAFITCRESVGHLPVADIYSCSKEEAFVNAAPDIFVLFGDESIENSLLLCKDLSQIFSSTALIVFVTTENYKLRTLTRFESLGAEVFSVDEPPVRAIHRIAQIQTQKQQDKKGKLITIDCAKGGIGGTTITSGLAHALQAFDRSSVVIDLSQSAALLHYLNASKWHSPDYAAALTDSIYPDEALVARCLTTAPNGINALLPPAGGAEIRELWLRDPKSFEITLAIIDILRSQFDYLLVDIAGAEGILPYALIARSDFTLLISSNDPASVHLLNSKISALTGIPGSANLQILINILSRKGLNPDDIIDFLYVNPKFKPEMLSLPILKHDSRGDRWIGTGNTIYTEGNKKTRFVLETAVRLLEALDSEDEELSVKRIFFGLIKRKALPQPKKPTLGLPYNQQKLNQMPNAFQPTNSSIHIDQYSHRAETSPFLFCKAHKSVRSSLNEISDQHFIRN